MAEGAEDENGEGEEDGETTISNKRKKKEQRMQIATLKQLAGRPDLVEPWDTSSRDPLLLVYLKSCRNSVQGKR
jgi:splicing factor 3B subunit 2